MHHCMLKVVLWDFRSVPTYLQLGWVLYSLFNHIGPNHLVYRTSCRISIGDPLDSTECPVGFYWTSTRILQVGFKCLRIANFSVTSRKICIGYPLESSRRPVESSRRPVELLYWTSPRAEDLADYCCNSTV